MSNFSNFVIEYLGEIETEFENTLPCLSGAQMGSNHGNNSGRKSRDTLPLSNEPRLVLGWVTIQVLGRGCCSYKYCKIPEAENIYYVL